MRYHYPPEEEGRPVGQMRPRKIDDDLVDDLRAFATHRWPRPENMNEKERFEAEHPMMSRERIAADIAAGVRRPTRGTPAR